MNLHSFQMMYHSVLAFVSVFPFLTFDHIFLSAVFKNSLFILSIMDEEKFIFPYCINL